MPSNHRWATPHRVVWLGVGFGVVWLHSQLTQVWCGVVCQPYQNLRCGVVWCGSLILTSISVDNSFAKYQP
jgi:hypothetical protein